MITVSNIENRLMGNQMFLVAAAIGLAIKNNDEVILHPWKYENTFKRKIKTDSNVYKMVQNYYSDPYFHYTPITYNQNLSLKTSHVGYYQSEKYFEHCKDLIREYFEPNDTIKEYIEKKYGCYKLQNWVSIHVRRGDYLQHQAYHPVCTIDYYRAAASFFPGYNFLVITNDKPWCKEMFKGEDILISDETNEEIDMFLQTYCKHNIIANSTFSWWGAWLNPNPYRLIIVPKTWFGPAYKGVDTKDLIPEKWIQIC